MKPIDDRSDIRQKLIPATPAAVFAALSHPARVARWWGPAGFTNTIHEFDFTPGGQWLLTMHGPDGKDYPNESRFLRVQTNRVFEIEHLNGHHFVLTIELEFSGNATLVKWRQTFETVEHYERIASFVATANEQNLERLAAEVLREAGGGSGTVKLKRLQFTVDIASPAATVFNLMLDADAYRDWSSAFAQGSYYEGSWQQGQTIRFMSPSGDGMVSQIAEHRKDQFISIRHLGLIAQGVEDTDSPAARAWAPAYENYSFIPTTTGTRVVIDQDVTAEFEQYIVDAWPKALARLKALCEAALAI